MSQSTKLMKAAMTMTPPMTPPTIAPTGVFAPVADELPLGALLPVTLLIVVVVEEAVGLKRIL
jgi:hypothetical protein